MRTKARRPRPDDDEVKKAAAAELVAAYGERITKMGRGFRQRHMPALGADDLAQAGHIAMIGAAQRFDPSRGVPFGAFLQTRLKGSMRDSLRAEARQSKRDRAASPTQRQEPGEPDVFGSIAANEVRSDERAARRQIAELLTEALDVLNPRERKIIVMVYAQGMTQRYVGELLGLTPGRICQIQTGACAKLREYFRLRGIDSVGEFL